MKAGMRGYLKIELQQLDAEGKLPALKKIYCPPRNAVLSLEECAACEHCTGCVIDTGSNAWALRCERAVNDEPSKP